MSSFSSPYQIPIHPPSGDWLAPGDSLLAPARRAGTLMLIMAAFAVIGGLLMISAAFMPLDELLRRSHFDLTQLQGSDLTPTQFLRITFILTAVFSLGVGITFAIMGWLTRKGGIASAIVSVVLVGLLTMLIGVEALAQLVQAALQPSEYIVGSAMFSLLLLAALVLLITWLSTAIKAAGALQRSRQRQTEQWNAMQHHPAWNSFASGFGPTGSGGGSDAVVR